MESTIKEFIKHFLPMTLRIRAGDSYRNFRFNRAFRRFLKKPRSCSKPDNSLLKELRDNWNNSGWSADEEYLISVMKSTLNARGTVLECGSGLTTLLAAVCAEERGVSLIAFEHNEKWADRVRFYLEKYRIYSASVITTPLISYENEDFDWYRVPDNKFEKPFSLVICDGPPGSTRGGRYGLVPVMKRYLSPTFRILLDDAERDEEKKIAERWSKETGAVISRGGIKNPYFILDCP
jgi:hypothetical protein